MKDPLDLLLWHDVCYFPTTFQSQWKPMKSPLVEDGFLDFFKAPSQQIIAANLSRWWSFRQLQYLKSFSCFLHSDHWKSMMWRTLFFCIIILDKWLRGAKQDSLIFKPHALRFYKLLKHPGTLATASCFEYMVTVCLHIRRPFVSRAQNSTSPNSELWEVV